METIVTKGASCRSHPRMGPRLWRNSGRHLRKDHRCRSRGGWRRLRGPSGGCSGKGGTQGCSVREARPAGWRRQWTLRRREQAAAGEGSASPSMITCSIRRPDNPAACASCNHCLSAWARSNSREGCLSQICVSLSTSWSGETLGQFGTHHDLQKVKGLGGILNYHWAVRNLGRNINDRGLTDGMLLLLLAQI